VTTIALAGSLGIFTVITLLICLIQKEMISPSNHPRAQGFGKVLNMIIIPFLMAFILVAISKLSEVL
jgi:Na+/H+-dicarboxylate symporter